MSIAMFQKINNPKDPTCKREQEAPFPLQKVVFNPISDYLSKMQNIRIIQKNLVYLIGLSKDLAFQENLLAQFEYLGQYGTIKKLVVNKNKTYNGNGPNGPSYSCHVTFASIDQSSLAILALDNAVIDNHVLKASFGTTKYCSNFLRNSVCMNKDCLYLHSLANESDILSRNEMNSNKEIFASQHVMAIELSEILTSQTKQDYLKNVIAKKKTIFPNASEVYEKEIVKKYAEEHAGVLPKPKKTISIIGLNKLYKKKEKSRFDFATEECNKNEEIDVPDEINSFLTENFEKSILFKEQQKEMSQYFFSLKKSKEAEDSWSSLVSTLNLYSSFENDKVCCSNKVNENNDFILVSKFNSA